MHLWLTACGTVLKCTALYTDVPVCWCRLGLQAGGQCQERGLCFLHVPLQKLAQVLQISLARPMRPRATAPGHQKGLVNPEGTHNPWQHYMSCHLMHACILT